MMRALRRSARAGTEVAVAALLLVALVGCWPAPGQGPDRRSYNPFEGEITRATVATLAPLWTAATDPAEPSGPSMVVPGPPVVSGAGVHVSDRAATYGFDAATGERLWRTPADSPMPSHTVVRDPIVGGDKVLLSWEWSFHGGHFANAVWLDAATGAAAGDAASGPIDTVRTPRLAGIAYHDDDRGGPTISYLEVVDTRDAATGWRAPLDLTFDLAEPRAVLPVTLGTRRVYVAGRFTDEIPSPGGPLAALAVRAYPFTAPSTCGRPVPGYEPPCPLWSTELDAAPATSPVLGPGERAVYVISAAGTLYALDADDGHVLWTTILGSAPSANPALAYHRLYVPLTDGDLAVVPTRCRSDRSSCGVAWRASLGGAATQPAVAGGVVVAGTRDGMLQVVAIAAAGCRARRCPTLWRHPLDAPVSGAPAISGGHLYVGLTDQRILAFAADP